MRCSFRAVSSDILMISFSFTPVFQTWNMENTEVPVKKVRKNHPQTSELCTGNCRIFNPKVRRNFQKLQHTVAGINVNERQTRAFCCKTIGF